MFLFWLVGFTELELPETRKRKGSKATYVDAYPFIWNDFKANGYVTGIFSSTLLSLYFLYMNDYFKFY